MNPFDLPPLLPPDPAARDLDAYEAERLRAQSGTIFASMERKLHGHVSKATRKAYPGVNAHRPARADNGYDPHGW